MSNTKSLILIVDDDEAVCMSLSLLLKRAGYATKTVHEPVGALNGVTKEKVSLVLLDMNFTIDTSGRQGIALLGRILEVRPDLPVILMTGWGSMELAVEGMKAGARDFITKPWDNDRLLDSIHTTLALEVQPRKKAIVQPASYFDNIIGQNEQMHEVLETVEMVANTDASVLILGESGTGKELIAEAIHQQSGRNSNPFVKVNLGGISSSLFESEMFGHVKGAFTDAHADREGRFSLAHTGTIFLDEIGDLVHTSQVKLLRVLQDNSYEVLGSSRTEKTDVRVISATNKNLEQMVFDQRFREDLYYRINLITLRIPPLRERRDDIRLLIDHFIAQMRKLYKRPNLEVDRMALNWLEQQSWPGNIRQLKNLIERAILMSKGDVLDRSTFQLHLARSSSEENSRKPMIGESTLEEFEKDMIVRAMKEFQGNISRVARALGITRSSLYRRLEKHEIKHER